MIEFLLITAIIGGLYYIFCLIQPFIWTLLCILGGILLLVIIGIAAICESACPNNPPGNPQANIPSPQPPVPYYRNTVETDKSCINNFKPRKRKKKKKVVTTILIEKKIERWV